MSKPLRSYVNQTERKAVIARRIKEATGGLGYLSALDAMRIYFKRAAIEAKALAKAKAILLVEEMWVHEKEQADAN